jgi:hypothetical protein
LRKLVSQGKVKEDVLATLGDILEEGFEIPPDILQALKENKQAWENFRKFPESYQRIRIGYIDHARSRPEEFEKRLKYLLKMTEQNKQFGFGIEDYM